MSIDTSPLLAHASPASVVAYRSGAPIEARQFLADAVQLAERLPPARHVLNTCVDRYRFTVGFAACLITGRVSLLPSTHTPEVIRQLVNFAPDVFCLTDEPACSIDLPRFRFPELSQGANLAWRVPQIDTTRLAAIVFTSGSTGTPQPYNKTWGKLARCVRDGAPRLGLLDGRVHTLIGTVPSQHMYGFESTVLLGLLSGNAFGAERPFYPADICAAVAAVPRPRALISTPVHLRALLSAGVALPPLELIVSATAPLTPALAHEVERGFRTRLLEIYGSTETGQIATRRTAESATWRLWPDVRFSTRNGELVAQGGHVEQQTAMCDVIELIGDDAFLLHGRKADLVNVAGKRCSFGYLNTQLNAIPGVVDGAFFLPETAAAGSTGVARLAAVVAAPALSAAQLTEQLRRRIDPVFMPRPLLMLERLPRNDTGKLPHEALQALVAAAPRAPAGEGLGKMPASAPAIAAGQNDPMPTARAGPAAVEACCELRIAADHPAFAGHFPGFPVLPGAVLMDSALREIERSRRIDLKRWRVASMKFLGTVHPGAELTLEHAAPDPATIRFAVRSPDRAVASGMLRAIGAGGGGSHGT